MPPVRPPLLPASLGLVLPPVCPRHGGDAVGTTSDATEWSTAGTTFDAHRGTAQGTAEWCRAAEEAGADALWATDHLFWGQATTECLTSLAVAATATARAVLGTCVLQLPLRSAPAVAKQAGALQVLSGGRLVLGVGVGSHPGEYELAGCDFHTRGAALDRAIAALRRSWATAGAPGLPYRQEPAAEAPVWIGGSSPAARRRAARSGDGWVPLFLAPDELAVEVRRLREDEAAAGREPGSVCPAVVMVAAVDRDRARAATEGGSWLSRLYGIPPKAFGRHLVAGPAAACAEVAARYFDAGAEHVAVMVAGVRALDQFTAVAAALGRTPCGAAGAPAPTSGLRAGALAGVGA